MTKKVCHIFNLSKIKVYAFRTEDNPMANSPHGSVQHDESIADIAIVSFLLFCVLTFVILLGIF